MSHMKPVLFLPGDIIVREGEQGDNMYFLNKGEVQVKIRTNKNRNDVIASVTDGGIFGEVALVTKLKRTATIKSYSYSSCAYLDKNGVKLLETHFPYMVQQLKEKIKDYCDLRMHFRRSMLKNLHYFSRLSDDLINELICCMEVKRFAKGSVILKCGDVSDVRRVACKFNNFIEVKLCEAWRDRDFCLE